MSRAHVMCFIYCYIVIFYTLFCGSFLLFVWCRYLLQILEWCEVMEILNLRSWHWTQRGRYFVWTGHVFYSQCTLNSTWVGSMKVEADEPVTRVIYIGSASTECVTRRYGRPPVSVKYGGRKFNSRLRALGVCEVPPTCFCDRKKSVTLDFIFIPTSSVSYTASLFYLPQT